MSHYAHPPAAVLVTQQSAAVTLGVSAQTIARLVRRGELEAVRVGRSVRITVASVEAFLQRKGVTQ